MGILYRPIACLGPRPPGAHPLAGGWAWFDQVEVLAPDGTGPEFLPASQVPGAVMDRLTAPRAPLVGLGWDRPRIMGILNVTPDSFSDGGVHDDGPTAAATLVAQGADILDIGGESTRPGATPVPVEEEISRVLPAIKAASPLSPVSIDTRNAATAQAALTAGALVVNDVTALRHDPAMAGVAAGAHALCLMHSQGTPETMQKNPRYGDVVREVYDHLEGQIAVAEAAGVPRSRIIVDPGIGFGKTLDHNLALLRALSVFHGLGCPILLGVSRKGMIGALADVPDAQQRMPGTLALTLLALGQGVQLHRVHDIAAAKQALALWQAQVIGTDG